MKSTLKLIFLAILMLTLSCTTKNNEVQLFYDVKNKTIYEFKSSELLIYNLSDSIKQKYSLSVKKDKFILNNNFKEISINFLKSSDSIWLLDYDQYFSNDVDIKLVKISFGEKINSQLLYNNYWQLSISNSMENQYIIKHKKYDKDILGDMYLKKSTSEEIQNLYSFELKIKNYFDKFNVYTFDNDVMYGSYFLTSTSKKSLVLKNLKNLNELKLNNFNSNIDINLYGRWKAIDNVNYLNLLIKNDGSLFYFGEEILFTKENEYFRFTKDSTNLGFQKYIEFYKTYSHKNSVKENEKEIIQFEFGLDTKFLFLKSPLKKFIEIEQLSKDTLILKNKNFINKKVKYIKIDNGATNS